MSDFSDRELVAGSLTGVRSFKIDKLGRLTGVIWTKVWTPGENVAKCFAVEQAVNSRLMRSYTLAFTTTIYGGIQPSSTTEAEPGKTTVACERAGSIGCTCGYYAYFDTHANPHHQAGQVNALIEGYGVVTVGLRGFRSEKARVQALIIKPKQASAETDRVQINYPDVPVFPSKAAAFEVFPLTPQRPVSPTDIGDEFWTREA